MPNQCLEAVIPIMNVMAQVEGTIARFYNACAESFPVNKDFWEQLAKEETVHEEAVKKLMRAAKENPQMFAVGDVSPLEALELFVARVSANFEQLREGHLTEDNALLIAYLIENTFVEGKYDEIIKLKDTSQSKTLAELSCDSIEHRERVLGKMRDRKQE